VTARSVLTPLVNYSILYDRLQSSVAPTNPYSLSSAAHLSTLASSSDPSSSAAAAIAAGVPPSILSAPSYPLADPSAPDLFLKQLDAQKLAAMQQANAGSGAFGEAPNQGIKGESQGAMELSSLLAAGGPAIGEAAHASNGSGGGGAVYGAAFAPRPPIAAAAPPQHSAMQVDQA
jgi:hypothetical protein